MKSYAYTETAGGLVVPFHTLEPGASAPRRPKDGPPSIVVLHYTACPDLPRFLSATRTVNHIRRAIDEGMVDRVEALDAARVARSFSTTNTGYGPTGQVPDAIAQAAIAAASPREACGHYYVASTPGILTDDGAELLPIAARSPRPVRSVPVVEFVDPGRIAHHVGPLDGWTNRRSVGIEVCYPGPAPRKECRDEEHARAWYSSRWWPVPDSWSPEVCLDGLPRWFAPLPPQVVNVVVGLVADLCGEYTTISHVCSHWLFAPTKRIDPDPPLSVHDVAARAGQLCGRQLATTKQNR